tara:strand:- start:228 stop:425 length:198 start_codon:yes stop_codon:yes gene_type:complete
VLPSFEDNRTVSWFNPTQHANTGSSWPAQPRDIPALAFSRMQAFMGSLAQKIPLANGAGLKSILC